MSTIAVMLVRYLIGLLGITVVVVIHEIGHLLAAKFQGIEVEVFSFGLGPKLVSKVCKGTEYRISLFPLGGYCRLKGSDDLSQALIEKQRKFTRTEEGSLFSAHPLGRVATYLAGPLANLCFAILLYALVFSLPVRVLSHPAIVATVDDYPTLFDNQTSPAHQAGIQSGDLILKINNEDVVDWEDMEQRLASSSGRETFTVQRGSSVFLVTVDGQLREDGTYRYGMTVLEESKVGNIRPFSTEARAGLREGDVITSVNGKPISNHLDLLQALNVAGEQNILTVERSGSNLTLRYTPTMEEDGIPDYQFSLATRTRETSGSRFSLITGWKKSWEIVKQTMSLLTSLFDKKEQDLRSSVTGMARSALIIGDLTSLGLEQNTQSGLYTLLYLMGVVSISLAVANLIPLPAFDGGQILIAIIEWLAGKQIRPKTYYILQLVGIACIMGIFLLLTMVDIRHFLAIRH